LKSSRNGRSAVPEGGGWRAKISAAALKISSNFFERTPPKSVVFKSIEVRIKFYRIVKKFKRKIFLTPTVIRVIIY